MIEIKNLSKKFRDFIAVDNINFSVKQGEIFAFLGPNGAGKSTTIKMLTTLLRPNQGEIFINQIDALQEANEARRQFGIVFQDQSLDEDLTAWENINFHGILYGMDKKNRHERAETLLKLVDLWDRRKILVKKFSGGMKRRLEIARGLLHHPRVIFLDEPTQGLDPQTRNLIWQYLKDLNQKENTTIFFTTHYMDEAEKMAERIAIIDQGKIIKIGSQMELKNDLGANSLEEVFLKLTGKKIREEDASPLDRMRLRRVHRGH